MSPSTPGPSSAIPILFLEPFCGYLSMINRFCQLLSKDDKTNLWSPKVDKSKFDFSLRFEGPCVVPLPDSYYPGAISERKGNTLKGSQGLYRKAKARICPWLSYMCHIRSTVDPSQPPTQLATREFDRGEYLWQILGRSIYSMNLYQMLFNND